MSELPRATTGRSYLSARQALAAASCLRCHLIGDQGGRIGPDLSNLGKRLDARAILEAILLPSKTIDPKYRHTTYVLDNGTVVQGRPVGVSARELVIETDPLKEATIVVQRGSIEESRPAELSPMPENLVDVLTADAILDVIAYLRANGDPEHPAFRSK